MYVGLDFINTFQVLSGGGGSHGCKMCSTVSSCGAAEAVGLIVQRVTSNVKTNTMLTQRDFIENPSLE